MARKAIYKHAAVVDTNTYPDDGSSPVGSNEWNADPAPQGMYGNTPTTATITISSGVLTPTDSVTVAAAESSTSDTLQKLALTNTNQYDLIYLFADTGDTITLEHGDLNADGEISTVSGSNETLSTTVPTILMRKGNYWYGYGGGVVNAVSDIGDVTISSIGSGELLKWNGSAWINQTLTEAGIVDGNLGTPSALVGTNISGTAASLTAGAVTTNANLTGEVTSSGNASTIADNMVDEANLKASNSPTNGYVLTARSGNTGGMTWEAAAGGFVATADANLNMTGAYSIHDIQTLFLEHQSESFDDSSNDRTDESQLFVKYEDTNNDGLYVRLRVNGSTQNVKIA